MLEQLLPLLSKAGLGDKANPFLALLLDFLKGEANTNPAALLDKFKALGTGTVSADQAASFLGPDFIAKATGQLGLSAPQVSAGAAATLPAIGQNLSQNPDAIGDTLAGWITGIAGTAGIGALSAKAISGAVPEIPRPAAAGSNPALMGLGFIVMAAVGFGIWSLTQGAPSAGAAYKAEKEAKEKPVAAAPATPPASGGRQQSIRVGRPVDSPAGTPSPAQPAPANAAPPAPSEEAGREALENLGAEFKAEDLVKALNLCVINFETGSATIAASSQTLLKEAATVIAKAPAGTKIEVGGHTDNVGNPANNQRLSEQRARAVINFLTANGVKTEKLVGKGYGDTKPIAPNDTDANKAKNRRMAFTLLPN